ncbi:MAG: hypothetical protein JF597_25795 [Streptomyces sp.]|uniref:hypothetical protein n=1 Tax=Streptomyces sp. TaxID=1931 RepID=UPI0025D32E78|nr:hypothetical protein [Streptomyces sp.]MBW8796886.1 hypothetical protein [Streptomyces sp.]
MTTETAGCFRPGCRMAPKLKLTLSGSLEIDSWCSDACREWAVMSAAIARCEITPDVERQAERLYHVGRLLDLRENADDVTFSVATTPVVTSPTPETGAFDERP